MTYGRSKGMDGGSSRNLAGALTGSSEASTVIERVGLEPKAAAPVVEIPFRIVIKASILSSLVLRPGRSRVNE